MALPALAPLVIALWVIACALVIFYVMHTVGQVLAGVPVVGGYLSRAANAIAHAVNSAVGTLESGVDKLVGLAWHATAGYLDRFWNLIKAHAGLLAHLGGFVGLIAATIHLLKHEVHGLTRHAHGIGGLFHRIDVRVGKLAHRVHALEQDIAKGIGEDVLPRIRSLDRRVANINHGIIPGLRRVDKYLDGRINTLYDWIKGEATIPGVGTLASIIAAAVAALGLDWLGCKDGASRAGRSGCDLWDDIGSLLGLAALAITIEDFDALVHEAQDLTGEVVTGLHELWNL